MKHTHKTKTKHHSHKLHEKEHNKKFTRLNKKHFNLKTMMIATIAVLLLFTFLHTIVTNPVISGYSVVDAETQDTERFSTMSAILIVIFAFFGLFLFILKKKMK